MRRTPIRPKRPTPRRRTAPKERTPEWWTWATDQLLRRSGGRCERDGCDLYANGMERHHRLRTREGGDVLSNLLALSPRCHAYVTEHPTESYANGWMVHAETDPAEVPVVIGGWRWYLDDRGTKQPVP